MPSLEVKLVKMITKEKQTGLRDALGDTWQDLVCFVRTKGEVPEYRMTVGIC